MDDIEGSDVGTKTLEMGSDIGGNIFVINLRVTWGTVFGDGESVSVVNKGLSPFAEVLCSVGVTLLSMSAVKRGRSPSRIVGTFTKFGVIVNINVQKASNPFKSGAQLERQPALLVTAPFRTRRLQY